jgi:hypothetical protein
MSRQRFEQNGRCPAVAGLPQIGQAGPRGDGGLSSGMAAIWG